MIEGHDDCKIDKLMKGIENTSTEKDLRPPKKIFRMKTSSNKLKQ